MDPVGWVVAGTIAIAAIATTPSRSQCDVKKCVEAYYSDKFNEHPSGNPSATFITCMEKNFPRTFSETEQRYNPKNVTLG